MLARQRKTQPMTDLLRLGSTDHVAVKDWQATLVRLDLPPGPNAIAVDGIFGPKTEAATKAFQCAAGIDVDGIVGPQTRAAAESIVHRDTKPENLIHGIDVSDHQGEIDWGRVGRAGKAFAILKATEGSTWTGETFAKNWRRARAEALKITAYHYFKANTSPPEAQAAHFLEVYRGVGGDGDLPVAVDVEEIGRGQSSADLVQRVLAFVEIVEADLGGMPLLYTYTNFAKNHFAGSGAKPLARLPLWLACYRERPEVPPPWSFLGRSWVIWQSTDKGVVDGIDGGCDLDVMKADALATAR